MNIAHRLLRKQEKLKKALSLLDPEDKKLRKFREYFNNKISSVQKEIDKLVDDNDGILI